MKNISLFYLEIVVRGVCGGGGGGGDDESQ